MNLARWQRSAPVARACTAGSLQRIYRPPRLAGCMHATLWRVPLGRPISIQRSRKLWRHVCGRGVKLFFEVVPILFACDNSRYAFYYNVISQQFWVFQVICLKTKKTYFSVILSMIDSYIDLRHIKLKFFTSVNLKLWPIVCITLQCWQALNLFNIVKDLTRLIIASGSIQLVRSQVRYCMFYMNKIVLRSVAYPGGGLRGRGPQSLRRRVLMVFSPKCESKWTSLEA